MEIVKPSIDDVHAFMEKPQCIRNVSILAHVDHGKTTLCDSLLATNRLISKRMAGTARFLDDRLDEQERGITMKSSAITLVNMIYDPDCDSNRPILLNLIDTPGHIDFSSEVNAALKVCDGALIVVDVVEGVCVQTFESIRKAYNEKTRTILLMNKFDKLILDLNMSINDIYHRVIRIIEMCNVALAEAYNVEFGEDGEDIENTGLLFSPETGNVIFGSALDGWAFTMRQMAMMIHGMVVNETVDSLTTKMWNFDCYFSSSKEIRTGAIVKGKENLFEQFCIRTIYQIYEIIVIRQDTARLPNVISKLGIKTPTREMLQGDPKQQAKAVLSTWKPIAYTLLLQFYKLLPSPNNLPVDKIEHLLAKHRLLTHTYIKECVTKAMKHISNFSAEEPTFAYVSKMFCADRRNLSDYKPAPFVPKPRSEVLKEIAQRQDIVDQIKKLEIEDETAPREVIDIEKVEVIALTRIYSGTLKEGDYIYVVAPAYVPNKVAIATNKDEFVEKNKFIEKVKIRSLYMLFGRELVRVKSIPPGNFCGVGGLEMNVVRTASLSSILEFIPFFERRLMDPVVRHSIEPSNPRQMPALRQGLKLLMQSDSCVQVIMQETGELILLTAGDVHLAKCLEDLVKKFAKIPVTVSQPMVSLRETVLLSKSDVEFVRDYDKATAVAYDEYFLCLFAIPIPENIVKLIKEDFALLKGIEDYQSRSIIDIVSRLRGEYLRDDDDEDVLSEYTEEVINKLKVKIQNATKDNTEIWCNLQDKLWSVGTNSESINILVNDVDDFKQNIFIKLDYNDKRSFLDHCVVNAFYDVCKSGPICEEPLMNVAFYVKKFGVYKYVAPEDVTPQAAANYEGCLKNCFKSAFEKIDKRLMEPMYCTEIDVNTNILGKVYSVVGKRHGKVLEAVGMDEEEKKFLVKAQIPVIESTDFANEIRKTTSGQAQPTLSFSHFEIIDGDPYYVPVEDDDEEEDVNVEAAIRATKIKNDIRRRKGLAVDDQVVTHAEKQRTLNKKK